MQTETLTVRASSLSGYPDCPRRWAARHLLRDLRYFGFETRRLPSSIGAVVGSGTHAAIAHDMETKMATGAFGNWTETQDRGEEELITRFQEEGAFFDDVTPTLSDAKATVRRLARLYRQTVGATLVPIAVERRLKAKHKTGLILSGQQDVVVQEDDDASRQVLRDVKTGKRRGANYAQYGAYSRLLRSHGRPIGRAVEDYLKRVPVDHEQPAPVAVGYDLRICEQQMETTLTRIYENVEDFRVNGEPDTFLANPSSPLCSDRYCPAWGTSFCPFGRK